MAKIRVLIVMTDNTSVGHFRSGWPGAYLRDHFSDEIDVTVRSISNVVVWDVIALSKYDIIHYNRMFGLIESTDELHKLLRDSGIKMVMDIDDYWDIPDEFPAKEYMLETLGGSTDALVNIFKNVDCVTTTTELFRKEILEHNKNVVVLPNAIDLDHEMWKYDSNPSDVVRIGWLGSNQRHHDLLRMKDSIQRLYDDKELEGKFSFVQAGGEAVDNSIFDGPGFKWFGQEEAWAYGKYYAEVDVCLAPLKDNKFSKCKSEIKMVEAGMNKKVFIGQDLGIYSTHIKHGENGFLVKSDDEWYDYMKFVILTKGCHARISQSLHDYVNPKFSINEISKQRINFYKNLMNEKMV
jgi:hypothetical protein